jgi:hypothetical protein
VIERKGILLWLDPAVHDALAKWAADELRSTNAQIESLLRRALAEEGRCQAEPARCIGPVGRHAAARRASHPTQQAVHAYGCAARFGRYDCLVSR